MTDLARRIKKAREDKGLSHRQFAKIADEMPNGRKPDCELKKALKGALDIDNQ